MAGECDRDYMRYNVLIYCEFAIKLVEPGLIFY